MVDTETIELAVRMILKAIGEDPERDGLKGTPDRVAKMYKEIFRGIREDPALHLQKIFSENHEEMILVKNIPLYSVCEHHLLPFYGYAAVAYIPRAGCLTGLSKLARVVDGFARRPQLQERLTSQIADTIVTALDPHGVAVVIEAEHMCMTVRGVQKPGVKTVTSAVRGIFQTSEATRGEVLALIRG